MGDPLRDYGFTPFVPDFGTPAPDIQGSLMKALDFYTQEHDRRRQEQEYAQALDNPVIQQLLGSVVNDLAPSTLQLGNPSTYDALRGATAAGGAFGVEPGRMAPPRGPTPGDIAPSGPAASLGGISDMFQGGTPSPVGSGVLLPQILSQEPASNLQVGGPPTGGVNFSSPAAAPRLRNRTEFGVLKELLGPASIIAQQRIAGQTRRDTTQMQNDAAMQQLQLKTGVDLAEIQQRAQAALLDYESSMNRVRAAQSAQERKLALTNLQKIRDQLAQTELGYSKLSSEAMANGLLFGNDAMKTAANTFASKGLESRRARERIDEELMGAQNELANAKLPSAASPAKPAKASGTYPNGKGGNPAPNTSVTIEQKRKRLEEIRRRRAQLGAQ